MTHSLNPGVAEQQQAALRVARHRGIAAQPR
jgi:hypothetical protein